MRTTLFSVIIQRVVVISYRRFETTYRSHLQGSRIQQMTMEPIGCLATSVRNYHFSLRNPEEHSSQLLRGGSLKSGTVLYVSNSLKPVFLSKRKNTVFLNPRSYAK
jgi:hypothetical protein